MIRSRMLCFLQPTVLIVFDWLVISGLLITFLCGVSVCSVTCIGEENYAMGDRIDLGGY